MEYSVTVHPLNAPDCTLCGGANDYGVHFDAFRKVGAPPHPLRVGVPVDLCDECLYEIANVAFDEYLRTGTHDELARWLDQLATRLHRHN